MKTFVYRRTDLAKEYCRGLVGDSIPDYRSGLFLAAPRRTGKSTFLQVDLLPELESNGFLTVYADLWNDRSKDPAHVISEAIQSTLVSYAGLFEKLGAEKLTIRGMEFNLKATMLPDNISLNLALKTLSEVTKKPIALVIDEAQHALSTKEGTNTMFALKSARDTMNIAGQSTRLALVFTGSNRDKLANLTQDHKQPFYGVKVQRFPVLGKGFAEEFSSYYSKRLSGQKLDPHRIFKAFSLLGLRPEYLKDSVDSALRKTDSSDEDLNTRILMEAELTKVSIDNQLKVDLASLTTTQKAVFDVLVRNHSHFIPFSEETMHEYAKILGKMPSPGTVRTALETLRRKGFIWKESFGGYVLENENYLSLYNVTAAHE